MERLKNIKGISLIEVIVSLFIFATLSLTISVVFVNAVTLAIKSKDSIIINSQVEIIKNEFKKAFDNDTYKLIRIDLSNIDMYKDYDVVNNTPDEHRTDTNDDGDYLNDKDIFLLTGNKLGIYDYASAGSGISSKYYYKVLEKSKSLFTRNTAESRIDNILGITYTNEDISGIEYDYYEYRYAITIFNKDPGGTEIPVEKFELILYE